MTDAQAERIEVAIIEGTPLTDLSPEETVFLTECVSAMERRIEQEQGREPAARFREWAQAKGYVQHARTV